VKDSGSITLGIRESSYPLSYLDEKQQPIGYHIDICNRIVDAVKAQAQAAGAQGPTPGGDLAEPHPAGGQWHGGPRVRLDHQQRGAQKQVDFAPTTFVTNVRMAVKKSSGISRSASSAASRWPPPPAPPACS
jgi:glutamate/aspartate transport system substrate-binding protein